MWLLLRSFSQRGKQVSTMIILVLQMVRSNSEKFHDLIKVIKRSEAAAAMDLLGFLLISLEETSQIGHSRRKRVFF